MDNTGNDVTLVNYNSVSFRSVEQVDSNGTFMDFDSIYGTVSDWSSCVDAFDSSIKRASENEGFKKLSDAGLEGGFVSSFDKNIENLLSALRQANHSVSSQVNSMRSTDDEIAYDADDVVGNGMPPRQEFVDSIDNGGVDTSVNLALVDNAKEQLEEYKMMSMNDLSSIASMLRTLAEKEGKTLDEILSNVEYSSQIQNVMLSNQNISSELKSLIELGNIEITQQILSSIFSGNNLDIVGLDDNTIITIKNFLSMSAENNNLNLNSLLKDENNSVILKQSLKSFDNVSSFVSNTDDFDIKSKILQIYDGNKIENVASSSVNILRDYADQVAESKNIYVEDMLTGNVDITSEIQNLGKASVFANTLSDFNNNTAAAILINLFDGRGV